MQLLTFAINEDILYRKFLIRDVLSLYRTLGTTVGCISLALSWRPLSLFPLLKSPFLFLQSLLAACLRTHGGFPAVLVLVMLSSNVLILKSSRTLVLSPAPLKKWIRSPLSIRSFREICSSSGSEEESIFYAVWVYCFWKCCWPPAFWWAC